MIFLYISWGGSLLHAGRGEIQYSSTCSKIFQYSTAGPVPYGRDASVFGVRYWYERVLYPTSTRRAAMGLRAALLWTSATVATSMQCPGSSSYVRLRRDAPLPGSAVPSRCFVWQMHAGVEMTIEFPAGTSCQAVATEILARVKGGTPTKPWTDPHNGGKYTCLGDCKHSNQLIRVGPKSKLSLSLSLSLLL